MPHEICPLEESPDASRRRMCLSDREKEREEKEKKKVTCVSPRYSSILSEGKKVDSQKNNGIPLQS